jgi:hypothetical protein
MKRILLVAGTAMVIASCGGANDGDATTDTTSMPIDTALMNNNPNASNINTNTGSYPQDSSAQSDVRSSSASDPKSRNTTSGSQRQDSGRTNGGKQ